MQLWNILFQSSGIAYINCVIFIYNLDMKLGMEMIFAHIVLI